MLVVDEKGKGGGLLLSPRATLMPISDLVDFEEDEGGGKGERQNVFSMYIRVSVAWGCMSLSSSVSWILSFLRWRRHSQLDTTAFVYVHVTKMYDTHEP